MCADLGPVPNWTNVHRVVDAAVSRQTILWWISWNNHICVICVSYFISRNDGFYHSSRPDTDTGSTNRFVIFRLKFWPEHWINWLFFRWFSSMPYNGLFSHNLKANVWFNYRDIITLFLIFTKLFWCMRFLHFHLWGLDSHMNFVFFVIQ